jgi:hypothetical protein
VINFDNFDELQLLIIEVLYNFCRICLHEADESMGYISEANLENIKSRDRDQQFQVRGVITTDNGQTLPISGEVWAKKNADSSYRRGEMLCKLYVFSTPYHLTGLRILGGGMKFVVSKNMTVEYGYTKIGEFQI